MIVGDGLYNIEATAKLGIPILEVRDGGFDDGIPTEAGSVAICDRGADLLARFDDSPLATPR